MIVTKQDKAMLHGIANTEDKQDVLIRVFTDSLIAGSDITAPEIRKTIQNLKNLLSVIDAGEKEKKKDHSV